ncbi:lpxtg-motif cell wall anchor domain containing protein [Grosmannia clavigera kw1407]|uniref:Lpxtg-motif cell wall anchor domain containing protein n=1 Tax=Grosmannia clavigera (strain kw1407 / UAMH 11150) TaxID=655863 RepID=F0XQ56_GROCL|nr:lpxtg-motif cell wall anchor domain containing protein [Grosmannia clavigera kw1407]EFX00750.1 lpxtg-motif cell wall anchor domain containing protein [Grosmannia clavigera kw1407]
MASVAIAGHSFAANTVTPPPPATPATNRTTTTAVAGTASPASRRSPPNSAPVDSDVSPAPSTSPASTQIQYPQSRTDPHPDHRLQTPKSQQTPTHHPLHAHRQNHNSSKLPAFRFADLRKDSLVLPSRPHHSPPSPVSPEPPYDSGLQQQQQKVDALQGADSQQNHCQYDQQQRHQQPTPPTPPTTADANFTAPTTTSRCNSAGNVHNNTVSATRSDFPLSPTSSSSASGNTRPSQPARSRPSSFQNLAPPPPPHQQQSFSPFSRPASFPNSPPTVVVSAVNTTPLAFSSSPVTARLQRTLTDPIPSKSTSPSPSAGASTSASAATTSSSSQPQPLASLGNAKTQSLHRRAPASFSSHGLETSRGPPTAFTAKRIQAVNVQAAAAHAAATAQGSRPSGSAPTTTPAPEAATERVKSQRDSALSPSEPSSPQQSADDKRKPATITSRPPVSFRAPCYDSSSPRGAIPPIRSFRSSGSRKSLGLDMNSRPFGDFSDADSTDAGGLSPTQHGRSLRALEGLTDDEWTQRAFHDSTSTRSTLPDTDTENTADIFMRIAREDTRNRSSDEDRPSDNHSVAPASPTQVARRLSDQRETARSRRAGEELAVRTHAFSHELSQRALANDRLTSSRASGTQKPDPVRTARTVISSARPSPSTPRASAFFDTASEVGTSYARRRPSTDNNNNNNGSTAPPARTSSIKPSLAFARTYSSSPLVPKHTSEPQQQTAHEPSHGVVEGTESSGSTAAPSTVWDELDDLKSRMRRLELSGKIPPTSGAAMSRVSDDRPRTATTNATTVSASPKRGANSSAQADARSTTSSQLHHQQSQQQLLSLSLQQGAQPSHANLLTALQKVKAQTSDDVYKAMEAMAAEALALAQMVGVSGQPGPISSGASTIGGGGPATVTDRQLRRKADSICRSLTELCLTLNEEAVHKKTAATTSASTALTTMTSMTTMTGAASTAVAPAISQTHLQAIGSREEAEAMASPATSSKPFSPMLRRPTFDAFSPSIQTSPKAVYRFEGRRDERQDERRASLMMPSSLAGSRQSLGPPSTADNVGRRSSLLISRTRRAVTEEPTDDSQGSGRRSSILRMRRAGTEEPAEEGGRKSSLLLRSRRAVMMSVEDDDDQDSGIRSARSPARIITETAVSASGSRQPREYAGREYLTAPGETSPLGSSALPRRRLIPSSLSSRLVSPQLMAMTATSTSSPSSSSQALLSSRRFLGRSGGGNRDGGSGTPTKTSEDRAQQRQLSLGQTAMMNRTSVSSRRMTRDTGISNMPSAASQVGGYR